MVFGGLKGQLGGAGKGTSTMIDRSNYGSCVPELLLKDTQRHLHRIPFPGLRARYFVHGPLVRKLDVLHRGRG